LKKEDSERYKEEKLNGSHTHTQTHTQRRRVDVAL